MPVVVCIDHEPFSTVLELLLGGSLYKYDCNRLVYVLFLEKG